MDVPIAFLRPDSTLVWFNKAANVLGFLPADIGRTPGDISALAGLPRLEEQCSQVIANGTESRADFRDEHKWFVIRISPYTKEDGQVSGIVLTFTNVTALRASIDQRAFISVNCAAIPASLIASELFGHEKGAFTGALRRRAGHFEAADGGTIFLDEIGELSLETQISLLRVLQEREFQRVGNSLNAENTCAAFHAHRSRANQYTHAGESSRRVCS